MATEAAVLVPYRASSPERARAWSYVSARYAALHPRWPVVVGGCGPGPWCKGAALAEARARVDAEVLVVADADSFVASEALDAAVARCAAGQPFEVPYLLVYRLNAMGAAAVYRVGPSRSIPLARAGYRGLVGGGIVVVRADTFDDVGGVDPRFVGWGGEDEAFGLALRCLWGDQPRPDGILWHLWHPHPVVSDRDRLRPERAGSVALLERYRAARADPVAMRALIRSRPCTPGCRSSVSGR